MAHDELVIEGDVWLEWEGDDCYIITTYSLAKELGLIKEGDQDDE